MSETRFHGARVTENTDLVTAINDVDSSVIGIVATAVKRRTKNAKTFHDKCENFTFRASNETAALTAVFLFIKWDHFGYG